MLGKGIADGKNKNLNNLIGKKFLNKKIFLMEKKLILIQLEKVKLLENTVKFSSGKK